MVRSIQFRFWYKASHHYQVRPLVCTRKLGVQRCFYGMVIRIVVCPQATVFRILLQEVLQFGITFLWLYEFQTIVYLQLSLFLSVHHNVAVLVQFVQLLLLLVGEFYLCRIRVVPPLTLQCSALASLCIGECHRRTQCIVLEYLHISIYWNKFIF